MPSLDALCEIADVTAVVCQPDKPAGRGLAITAPPVKTRAEARGLPIVQPTKLRTGEFGRWLTDQRADVALVVAYGRILPLDVLGAPRLGCVNVHASLLPKYRGAAPIVWAIAEGESVTGITLMKLDAGMDTGATFAQLTTPIDAEETGGELSQRLSVLGAEAVTRWLPAYVQGTCTLTEQDSALATVAPMLTKEDGRVNWTSPASVIHNRVRAMNPWPGAFTSARGRTVKIHAVRVLDAIANGRAPGEVTIADKSRVLVACGDGKCVDLLIVQPEGKRAMHAHEWVAGRAVAAGDVLGSSLAV